MDSISLCLHLYSGWRGGCGPIGRNHSDSSCQPLDESGRNGQMMDQHFTFAFEFRLVLGGKFVFFSRNEMTEITLLFSGVLKTPFLAVRVVEQPRHRQSDEQTATSTPL
ncbi:hypothetical protein SLA2020_444530 [Shorea laevis]